VTRKLTLKENMSTRNLVVAPDCAVVMNNDKPGMLSDLQIGDAVQVVYEPVNGSHMASRIEQKSEMFVGTVEAVDATTRTVKAKDFLSEKRFNLADDCPVVVNGKPDGSLGDLRIGDRVTFNYENTDGVLVANRISPTPATIPAAPAPAQTAKASGQLHNNNYTPSLAGN
jgi:Cu/Ag efflux protein CusF